MSSTTSTIAGARDETDLPSYPQVSIRAPRNPGQAHHLVGQVGAALRRQVGDHAADQFWSAAERCPTQHAVLALVTATVTLR